MVYLVSKYLLIIRVAIFDNHRYCLSLGK